MRVGINGMGQIGRLALRAALGGVYREADDPRADNRLDIVHVNELRGAATTAHPPEFDSLHGRWRETFCVEDDRAILIGNRRIGLYYAANAAGPLMGILLSGVLTQTGGMPACLWGSAATLAICLAVTWWLPVTRQATPVPA